MNPPLLELALEVRAQVGAPIEVGPVGPGRRRIVPILGGMCQGRERFRDLLNGRVLPGGADWQLVHEDWLTEADARYTLQTDPSLVYFYSTPTFETAAPALQPLTRSIFIGAGERYPSEVVLRFWKVG